MIQLRFVIKNKKHTKISTLDNFIDIMYFIFNPLQFLRHPEITYYPNNIKILNIYLETVIL